jgi:sortase A
MRKLALLLIIIGLGLLLYPSINHWYEDYKQQQLLKNWELEVISATEPEAPASSESVANQINQLFPSDNKASAINPSSTPTSNEVLKPVAAAQSPNSDNSAKVQKPLVKKKTAVPAQPKAIGLLQIDIIGLKLPIVEGISAADMRIAPGHIPGTALPGQTGNAVIAGHHSYTYGRMFNRLEELNTGDRIKVETSGHVYEYTIYNTKMVDPADLSVLNHNNTDKILTLITCDAEGKQRLILQAKLT